MDWDDLSSFHKPHKYLDDLPKKAPIDKKFHKSVKTEGKKLRSQKIETGKVPKTDYMDFDFKKYFNY